jgi:hypothetical protein
LIISCMVVEHNMNYQNLSLCPDLLMKEYKINTSS